MRKFFVLSFLLILFLCLCSIPKGYAKEIPDIETKVKNGHVTLKVNEKETNTSFSKMAHQFTKVILTNTVMMCQRLEINIK